MVWEESVQWHETFTCHQILINYISYVHMALVIAYQEHPTEIQTWKIASQYQRKKCISIGPQMMCELVLGRY